MLLFESAFVDMANSAQQIVTKIQDRGTVEEGARCLFIN
jgi:hypothetical protein